MSRLLTLLRRRGGLSWLQKNAIAGTWTLVEDDGSFTAVGDDYTFPAQTTPTWGDLGTHFDAQTRAAGLALYVPLALSTWEECGAGWHTAADSVDPDSMEHAIQANATDGQLDTEVPVAAIVTGLTSAEFKTLQVLRDTGCFYIVNGHLHWVSETGATATLYPAFSNLDAVGTWGETNTSVAQLADYNAAWGGDWSEVTDTETNPATSATWDSEIDSHTEVSFTVENTKLVYLYSRFTDASNYIMAQVLGSRVPRLTTKIGGTEAVLWTGSALTDATSYKFDIVAEGSVVKVYIDNVLMTTQTIGAVPSVTGSTIFHNLATNDIVLTTHPYPKKGIATDRVICPQTTNTYTHSADFVAEIKNVKLPAADNLSFQFRISGSDELTLNIASDGAIALLDNATSRISAAAGTVSDDDEIVLVCDGANGQIFVAGASVGTTTAIAHLTGTSGKRLDATTGTCDHIALFPRDVSSLLPKGTF